LLDPPALADLIRRERIECLELVPALANALATHLERQGEDLCGIRLLAVGSDALRARLYRRLRRLIGPGGRVVNSYGLTEATIDSTYFGGPPEDLDGEDGPVPIGHPFPGTRTYLLDGRGEPVPVGVVGELYIGGFGVARGYIADPRQTAERFVPDPHGGRGSRMYATGDRARWRDGGVLELLGRRDGQVKVRGFRVEFAEVEAAIGSWPGVCEVAVMAAENEADGQRLIAWIVGKQGSTLDVDSIRRFLRDRLPSPMIPSQIRIAESLPRTPSGKVDRPGLLKAMPDEVARDKTLTRPRDQIEEQLVAIWEDLLRIRPIGVTDGFFDLGGHSLLAVQLAARVEQWFGRALPLSDLLLGSTIEEIAARIRAPVTGGASSLLVDLRVTGPGSPLYLVHPIGGGVLCYNSLARRLDGQRAVLGFQAAGFEGEAEPETDLVRMASRYVDALRAEHPEGPYILGGWSMGGIVAFEMAGQLAAAGHDAPLVILIDCSVPVPRNASHTVDDLESLTGFAADLARTAGRETRASLERLRSLGPESIRNGAFDQTILACEIAGEIGHDRMHRLHRIFRANRLALDSYQPRAYPGRVILVQAESIRNHLDDHSTRGWNALALGGITIHRLPGDHYTIMQPPAVERLAEILAGELERHEKTTERNPLR
jgi:thioesterase domain-containing protein/acyl carrier protein